MAPLPMDMAALNAPATTAAMPPPSPSLNGQRDAFLHDAQDDDEEEAECRVCRGEAEPERRLFAPCRCSGSIRFTHSDCLEQWLEHSGKSYCELCGYKFEFKPLYDAAAPAVLPWSELVSTVASMALYKWLPFVVRGVLVVVLWLGVAPWCTSWLYRMWLLRASAMVNVNFSERFDQEHATADIFSGMIMIVVIIVSFLSLMSFADFLRFHLDHMGEPLDDDHAHQHNHHHANHNHNQVNPNANANVGPGIGAAVVQRDERPPLFEAEPVVEERGQDENDEAMPFPGVFARHPREELGLPVVEADLRPAEEDILVDERRPEQELRQRRPLGGRVPVRADHDVQNDPLPAPRNIAAPPPPPPRPQNAAANNRDVWEDDFEHMEINIAMDELLGLRGDFVVLFRNVSWLLAFNGAYLGLFAFIPYTLGSTIISAGLKIYSSLPIAPVIAGWFTDDLNVAAGDLSVGMFFVRTLTTAVTNAKKNGDCLQLVDLSTCFVGYISICFTIVLWRWMVATASPFMNRPLMGGAIWALRCLTAIVKVSTLLLLKMVALPVTLGIGINIATLRLFQVTMQERITFFLHNMVGSLLVHWVLGITFMLFITVSVLQLREVMHPDILAKVIRPQEAHPDLLRSLMSETCVKHARRMLLSLVIYAALLVLLIHVPIRLVNSIAPDMFPLQFRFQHYIAEIQVPIELLITHLIVLGILEQSKNAIGGFQYLGVHFFCSKLGLTEYLLPRVKVDWDSRTEPRGSEVVLAPPPLHFHPQAAAPPNELKINGLRYLPWPEDGLDDPAPDAMEYVLLRRQVPTKLLHARVATLVVAIWFVLVTVMGALIFGSFFIGRACLAPVERLTGITHDPLALAAGVQIVWYLANGINALNMLTLPEIQVERELLDRGYCVKNMTPDNAIMCVVGWAFIAPFFVGFLLAACFPSTKATWFEAFWLGYLVFNLAAWFVCCFRLKKNRRRRRRRAQPERVVDEDEFIEDDLLDELDEEDLDLDLDDEFLDEDEAEQRRANEDDAPVHVDEVPAPVAEAEVDGFIAALRKCYKQVMFNIYVHDNDAVRLRNDNLRDRCFDVKFFIERVLLPVLATLSFFILFCTLQSWVLLLIWSESSSLKETAFAISATGWGLLFSIVRGSPLLAQWTTKFAESIRNERYLIGRELQDMAR